MKYFLLVILCMPAINSLSQFAYVSSDRNEIYQLDLSGTCSTIPFPVCNGNSSAITDIAVDVFGKLYICINDSIYLFESADPSAGCRFVFSFGNYKVKCIEIGPDGRLYAAGQHLLRYDLNNQRLTDLGELPNSITAISDIVFYVNRLYLSTAEGSIYEADINDPSRSQLYFDTKIPGFSGFIVAPMRCSNATSDELRLLAFENVTNGKTAVHILDMEKKIIYTNYCSVDITVTGNSGFHPATLVAGDLSGLSFSVKPSSCVKVADGRIDINMNTIPVDLTAFSFLLNNGMENTTGVFTDLKSDNYLVRIINKMGCFKDTLLHVPSLTTDCRDTLFIPGAFTPNGDGKNDIFRVISPFPYRDFEIIVFSRSGQIVFKSNSILNGWDGANKSGLLSPAGIYIWQVKYRNLNGQTVYRSGHLALLY